MMARSKVAETCQVWAAITANTWQWSWGNPLSPVAHGFDTHFGLVTPNDDARLASVRKFLVRWRSAALLKDQRGWRSDEAVTARPSQTITFG